MFSEIRHSFALLRAGRTLAAYDALMTQAKRMKVNAQNYGDKQLDVGTIVQVPLADVYNSKADGKNLKLIIVD